MYPFDDDDEMVEEEPQEQIHAQDLRRMAFLMEQRHQSAMRVDNNLQVLRHVRRFFVEEVAGDLACLGDRHGNEMRTHIQDFADKVTLVIEEMEDWVDRAQALDRLAKNREEYVSCGPAHEFGEGQLNV